MFYVMWAWMLLFAFAVSILPVNFTADAGAEGFERTTLTNVGTGESVVWVHVISMYFNSFLFYYMILYNYADLTKYRRKYLAQCLDTHLYSVMVSELPGNIRSDQALSAIFKSFYPNDFFNAVMAKSIKVPKEVLESRDDCVSDLDKLSAQYESDLRKKGLDAKRPVLRKPDENGEEGAVVEVDAMNELKKVLAKENKELRRLQHLPHDTWPSYSVGFVTFTSLHASNSCAQNVFFDNPFRPYIEKATEASDLVWSNIRTSLLERSIRKLVCRIVVFLLMIFFFPVTGMINLLSNLTSLEQEVGFLNGICSWPSFIIDLIQGVLPGILLKVAWVVIPPICRLISFLGGYRTYSKVDRATITKVFYFSVFNIYIVSVIGGSFFREISPIIDDPKEIVNKMASGIPAQSVFFINYILLESGTGLTIQLLRLGRFFIYYFTRIFLTTRAQIDRARELENAEWHIYIPRMMLIFLIGVSYSTMAPLTCFACCLYFGGGHFIFKHQLMYVYGKQYQSGGMMWPKITTQLTGGLLIYQISMVGVFAAKKIPGPAIATAVLPFITWVFYLITLSFVDAYTFSSMAKCKEVDAKRGKAFVESFLKKTYFYNPPLTAPMKEFQEETELYFDETRYDPSGGSSQRSSSKTSELSTRITSRIASRAGSSMNMEIGFGDISRSKTHSSSSSINKNDLFIQSLQSKLQWHSVMNASAKEEEGKEEEGKEEEGKEEDAEEEEREENEKDIMKSSKWIKLEEEQEEKQRKRRKKCEKKKRESGHEQKCIEYLKSCQAGELKNIMDFFDELSRSESDIAVDPTVEMLQRQQLVINCRDNFGWTGLMCAAVGGHWDVCTFLCTQGGLPLLNATNNQGKTVADLVMDKKFRFGIEGKEWLQSQYSLFDSSYSEDIKGNCGQVVKNAGGNASNTGALKTETLDICSICNIACKKGEYAKHAISTVHLFNEQMGEEGNGSVHPMPARNSKGYKMMLKLGWREGMSLGKSGDQDILAEPIKTVFRSNRREGLGQFNANDIDYLEEEMLKEELVEMRKKGGHTGGKLSRTAKGYENVEKPVSSVITRSQLERMKPRITHFGPNDARSIEADKTISHKQKRKAVDVNARKRKLHSKEQESSEVSRKQYWARELT
eukprot:Nk52_evm14s1737 gene=Nk52_evmTU14s1737